MTQKALAIAIAGLGNAVMATPAVELLKKTGMKIDVLVSKNRCTNVVFMNWPEVIRTTYCVEKDYPRTYDYILWTHPNWGPERVKVNGHHLRLKFPKSVENLEYRWKFKIHETEMLANLVRKSFKIKAETPPARLFTNSESVNLDMPNPVIISMGYAKDNKKWLVKHWGTQNYVELCNMLHEDGFTPILAGSSGDYKADGKLLLQKCPFVVNLCGEFPIETTISVLGKCMGYIGNDSGLMHCASVQNIHTLGLFFSNGSSPHKNFPLGEKANWLWRKHGKLKPKLVFDVWKSILAGKSFKEMKICV